MYLFICLFIFFCTAQGHQKNSQFQLSAVCQKNFFAIFQIYDDLMSAIYITFPIPNFWKIQDECV